MGYIYRLVDPITNRVMYIGLTTQTLQKRLSGHIKETEKALGGFIDLTAKQKWIYSLLKVGMKPIIETVQICDSDSALRRAELFWIHSYLTEGTELLNIASNPLIRPVDTYTFDSLSTVEQIQHLYIDKRIDTGTIYDLYKKELSYIKEGLLKL